MGVAEYLIKCPRCHSETRLVAEESNPLIFCCRGCSRSIVVHNNAVFTVSEDYVLKLVRRYKAKACGRILASKVSEDAKKEITRDRIKELHNLLEDPMDVRDFIKKIR